MNKSQDPVAAETDQIKETQAVDLPRLFRLLHYQKIGKIWRCIYQFGFDIDGHWSTQPKGHRDYHWLRIGMVVSTDGIRAFTVIFLPFALTVGIIQPNSLIKTRVIREDKRED